MLKATTLSMKLDLSEIEKGHRLIDSLYDKIQKYNKIVGKSNELLREQEKLRRNLGIKVINGKVSGLVTNKESK